MIQLLGILPWRMQTLVHTTAGCHVYWASSHSSHGKDFLFLDRGWVNELSEPSRQWSITQAGKEGPGYVPGINGCEHMSWYKHLGSYCVQEYQSEPDGPFLISYSQPPGRQVCTGVSFLSKKLGAVRRAPPEGMRRASNISPPSLWWLLQVAWHLSHRRP